MKSNVRNILLAGVAISTIIILPFILTPRVVAQEAPTLTILGLDDGSTITLPAEIQYEVTGFQVGKQTGGHMNIYVGDPETSDQIEIPLEGQSGIAILPDDKRIPGVKDLTFHLADANNKLLPNPEAKVTFKNLIIQGRR